MERSSFDDDDLGLLAPRTVELPKVGSATMPETLTHMHIPPVCVPLPPCLNVLQRSDWLGMQTGDEPSQGRRGRRHAPGLAGTSLDLGIDAIARPAAPTAAPASDALHEADVATFDAEPARTQAIHSPAVGTRAMRSSWDDDDFSPPSQAQQPAGAPASPAATVTTARKQPELDIFDDAAPAAAQAAPQQPAMSRRKQQQLEMEQVKQNDKYAEDKEKSFDEIEELDDSGQVDLKGKVCAHTAPL